MKLKRKFLLVILLCLPFCNAYGAGSDENSLASSVDAIANAQTPQEAKTAREAAEKQAAAATGVQPSQSNTNGAQNNGKTNTGDNTETPPADNSNDDSTESTDGNTETEELSATEKQKLKDKKSSFEDAKATEQSRENRMLTAATTAATGIGGMELAMGLAEQKADKAAEQNMDAYIATFRCTYGNGKQVKASSQEIELPGGNDATMMKYRDEYFALAQSLKVRKAALEMAPGIEAEEIMDKSQMGLYDDENVGLTDGTYSSLYRAKMLGSEKDQQQIDEEKKKSKNRVIAGAVVGGVGVVGGAVGDSLINGKLHDLIQEKKDNKNDTKENKEVIKSLKQGLKSAGMTNVDKLDLSQFDMTRMKSLVDNTDFSNSKLKDKLNGESATDLINTSNSTSLSSSLTSLFNVN